MSEENKSKLDLNKESPSPQDEEVIDIGQPKGTVTKIEGSSGATDQTPARARISNHEVTNTDTTLNSPQPGPSSTLKLLLQGNFCKVTPENPSHAKKDGLLLLKSEEAPKLECNFTAANVQVKLDKNKSLNNNTNNLQPTITVSCPNNSGTPPQVLHRSGSTDSYEEVCRICHDTCAIAPFITPCICKGTMGLVHQQCLEHWLGESGKTSCEICGYEYITERRPKYTGFSSIWSWIKKPSSPNDTKNLFFDIACFFILTPLASISAWLCIVGSQHYALTAQERFKESFQPKGYRYRQIQDNSNSTWTSIGLLTLTGTLLTAYYVWLFVAFRYHYQIWKDWQNRNYYVSVLPLNPNVHDASTGPSEPVTGQTVEQNPDTRITIEQPRLDTTRNFNQFPNSQSLPAIPNNNSNPEDTPSTEEDTRSNYV